MQRAIHGPLAVLPLVGRLALMASLGACAAGNGAGPTRASEPPAPAVASPVAPGAPASTPAAQAPAAQAKSDGKPDLEVVHRIKDEAFRRGQVMGHLFWLTDVNGSRVTASPGFRTAADWAVRRLTGFGLANAHLESWGHFGRAWTLQRFEFALVEPGGFARLEGVPKAWSRGTSGAVTADLVLAPLYPDKEDRDDAFDLAKLAQRIHLYAQTWKGKLGGHFVLVDPPRDLSLPRDPEALRYDDKKLGELGQAVEHTPPEPWTWPITKFPRDAKKRRALYLALPLEVASDFSARRRAVTQELYRFFEAEGVRGVLGTDDRGEGATFFSESTGSWEASQTMPPATIAMPPEDYDRLARLAEKHVPAKVRLDAGILASEKDEEAWNVIAEIPGGAKRDEVVMIGAHLDSWHAGTGATDNGAGCAVMIEAARLLKALALPMARTVRIALWSGEEQGLHGSRGYVKQHFADPVSMTLKPEHAKLAAYFNLDNGTGKIRGIYLEENDMARPIFEAWLAPFKDEGAGTVTLRRTFGTDHESFDAVGLPGFQFVQDPLDYMARTHHSNLDVYEHAQAGDLMQASAIVASLVYEAANRAEMIPRKPLPAPLPPRAG